MKVAKSTRQRIAEMKIEAAEARIKLESLRTRLDEHSGTKGMVKKLGDVISRLDEWIKTT